MKTVAAVLSFVVLLTGCEMALNTQPNWRQPIDRLTTVRVTTDNGYGSGVIIAPNRVLTAKHVAEIPEIKVNGKPTKVLAVSETDDVAVLEADVACPCAPVARDLQIGEEIVIAGYPMQHIIEGILVRMRGEFLGYIKENFALFTGFAMPGSSGGGIFNRKGELVGVVSGVPVWDVMGPFGPPQLVNNLVASPTLKAIIEVIKKAR